ncbi:extracellular solute-binding protein [Paenibacillus pasadenensis]|uniref:ABC transporter substrate-binding protein n=1 Tax=Paenibacillus pasadenensis TaxID=217090 RepID=UPI00203E7638|nr:extracellular solute-binding protein [Paenibacillus pasadenensis]MCM3749086.1 extracellular solute-binding protein [Paenibacillus pasadenensis]
MMKKKSTTALAALSMAAVMALTACGGNEGGNTASPGPSAAPGASSEPSTAPAKEVSLRVFSTFGGTDAAREAFQKLLDDYSAKYPNVKIENDVMSANDDGFRTKVNSDMNSGNEPDLLFYFVGSDAKGFVDAGRVMPLNSLLDEDAEWKNGFIPSALESVKQPDGNIYAAPLTGFYEGLFVNKAIFEKYNLELPTDWDKLTKAVKALSDNGIIPLAAPFDQSHYVIEHSVLAAAGSDGQKAGLLNGINPEWELGIGKLKELGELGAFPKDAATIDLTMAANYYSQGLAAMVLEGSWAIGGMPEDVKATTTVLPFPAVPGGKGTGKDVVGGFGSGFYLSKAAYDNADKKDAAVSLLKYLTSSEAIKSIAAANGGTPAANVQIDGLPQVALDGFKMVADSTSVNSPIDSYLSPETFTTIRQNVMAVVKGDKTAKQSLEAAEKIEKANKQ